MLDSGQADADLPGIAEELGLPGFFDIHVHFMPPQVMRKVWAYFDSAGPLLGREWPIAYRLADDERVARLRAMGVKHFSALSYAHKPGMAPFLNDWTRDFAADKADCLWSGTFFPEPEAATYVPELIEAGVEVFKVHVQVGDFSPSDPLLEPVWGALAESGTPIVLHAGSGPAAGMHTGPGGVADVLGRHPDLSLVIAHMGTPEVSEFLDLAERYDNVRLDTTMAFTGFLSEDPAGAPELRPRLVDMQSKILLGSDFPNIPYAYVHQIESLIRLDLGDDWLRDVLWNNAHDLFFGSA
ncbi:MAG: amidohydrolase family protein [Aeromicrobium sp.]